MKVLILHQHFHTPDSGGPLRSYYLAKALIAKGYSVTVITGGGQQQRRYVNTSYEGIDLHYLPIAYANRFGFYKRGLSFARYALGAFRLARRLEGISVCYAISVPLTVGQCAIWIRRATNIPFIFEVGDLWPDAPIQLGFIHNALLKHSLLRLEKKIYQTADHVVGLSEPIASAISMKSPKTSVSVIPNMSDTHFLQPESKQIQLEQKFNVQGRFVVSYIGAIGFANGLDYFVDCARASQQANLAVSFIMCGEGALREQFVAVKKSLGLNNLTILPLQNRAGVKELMNVTDASFICYKPFPILETGSPHKYFDGLSAGKLIIVNVGGWMKEEITREQCGIALDPRYPHSFVEKITPFIEDKSLTRRYSTNARALAERKYSRTELSERFVRLLETARRS